MDIELAGEGAIIGLLVHEPDSDEPEEILPEETGDYAETAVKVGEYGLDGMLCMPKNAEAPPLLLLIWGSGQCDMNEVGVFDALAHGLAERGVATLRFNKRFYQFPEMATEDVTVDDEYLDDVDAAIALAQTYADSGEISGIYVLGHSLGGSLMPSIAERNSKVKAAISLAGTPRHLIDVWLEQLNVQLETLGEGPLRDYMETLIDQTETLRDEHIIKETDNPSLYQVTSVFFGIPYFESLQAIEPADIADRLTIPMLFLQGDADIQVYPDRDYPVWQEKLSDNPNCTFKLYEGLGHLFDDKNGDFDETVMDDIADFVKSN
jgi:dienelactone hydrolase